MLKQQFPHLYPLMKAPQDVVASIPGYFDGAHTTSVGLVAPTPCSSDGTHTKLCLNFQMNFPELAAQRSPGNNSEWEPGICVLVCLLESPVCPGATPGIEGCFYSHAIALSPKGNCKAATIGERKIKLVQSPANSITQRAGMGSKMKWQAVKYWPKM